MLHKPLRERGEFMHIPRIQPDPQRDEFKESAVLVVPVLQTQAEVTELNIGI
jgi:hypothetical protein